MQTIKKYIPSRPLRMIMYVLAALVITLFVFTAGMLAGYRHVRFGHLSGSGHFFMHRMSPYLLFDADGHGVIGTVSKIALPNVIVLTRDGVSSDILIASTTVLRDARGNAGLSALSTGETIVAIGVPNDKGDVAAKFIRIIGRPSASSSPPSSPSPPPPSTPSVPQPYY